MTVDMLPPPPTADAVFEGGGVKGIALVGGLAAAERAGVERWVNVAGTSAGAIVACLVAVGHDAARLQETMERLDYRRFADYGWPGKARGYLWNQLHTRGLAPGRYFADWLAGEIAESPLAQDRASTVLTFGDLTRHDLPEDVSDEERRRARYRLQVIASDVTAGRMLVLPHDIVGYSRTRNGPALQPDELTLVEAVRMSMSYPFLFAPVTLWRDGRPHFVVDGGLLSNFPIWLFDVTSRPPARPTWGFRLHGGTLADEQPPYHPIPMPFWRIRLLTAMFESATGAWDARQLSQATNSRTVSIPTGSVRTTDFDLDQRRAHELFERGDESTTMFFSSEQTQAYLHALRAHRAQVAPAPAPAH